MFGLSYLKAAPTTHVIQYHQGKIVREGAGLSFFYFAPTATIAKVPMSSNFVPFVFEEVTSDFQDVTLQGELTYEITDPATLASKLDYTVDARGRLLSDDPIKMNDRLIHAAQILARAFCPTAFASPKFDKQ